MLLEPAPAKALGERPRGARAVALPVPVRYTAPDGIEHLADVPATGPLPAGVAVPLWVDRSGEVVGAPGRTTDAVGRAAVGAAGILFVGPLILAGSWAGVRVGTRRVTWRGGSVSGRRSSHGGAGARRPEDRLPGRLRAASGPGRGAEGLVLDGTCATGDGKRGTGGSGAMRIARQPVAQG